MLRWRFREAATAAGLSTAALRSRGIRTIDALEKLIAEIGDRCESCGKSAEDVDQLCVDHDHQTGSFRGILCRACNTGLGLLGDAPAGVAAMLAYLERAEARTLAT